MIRLSRTGASVRCSAYLALAMLVAAGCAQNGVSNGGSGGASGTGNGGASGASGMGKGGSTSSASGGVGGGQGIGGIGGIPCPSTPTPVGFSCRPEEIGPSGTCSYGSATCCGVTYPTLLVECKNDSVVHQVLESPCDADGGYVCPAGGANGGGGAGGAGGFGGAGGAGGVTTCPVTAPPQSSSYQVRCAQDLFCTYGTRSCCGGSLSAYDQAFVCSGGGYFTPEVVDCPACPDASISTPHDGGAAGSGGTSGPGGAAGGGCCAR